MVAREPGKWKVQKVNLLMEETKKLQVKRRLKMVLMRLIKMFEVRYVKKFLIMK